VVLAASASPDDLDRLARTVAAETRPVIVVPGAEEPRPNLGSTTLVSGPVPDAELPDWLESAGAAEVLFGSSRWGSVDPRLAVWAEHGFATSALAPLT
jgi:hypothetical protein